jgi:hypothetical protein
MHVKLLQMCVLSPLLLLGLSGCSGEGGQTPIPSPVPPSASSAEGLWTGTITPNRTVTALVLDDGAYWFFYSSPAIFAGLVQGDSSSQNGIFTSSNAKDFNPDVQGIRSAEINGAYTTKQKLTGTISYQNLNNTQDTFTATYNRDYELVPNINAVVGKYTGQVAANEIVTVEVFANGDISGSSTTGCFFTGTFAPRTHGNVFNVTLTFGPQDTCSNKNDTVTGVGFFDAGTGKLYSAALNTGRTNGVIFIGAE